MGGHGEGQRYISVMADLNRSRVVAVTEGGDHGASGGLCDHLEARAGDRPAIAEVTRSMASSYSLGYADAMPGAAQTVGRLHDMRLLTRALDGMRRAEAKSGEGKERLLRDTKYVCLKRPENLTARQVATGASLASRAPADRPGLRHDRSGTGRPLVRDWERGRRRARPRPAPDHAL